jgi:hypothetical protein
MLSGSILGSNKAKGRRLLATALKGEGYSSHLLSTLGHATSAQQSGAVVICFTLSSPSDMSAKRRPKELDPSAGGPLLMFGAAMSLQGSRKDSSVARKFQPGLLLSPRSAPPRNPQSPK